MIIPWNGDLRHTSGLHHHPDNIQYIGTTPLLLNKINPVWAFWFWFWLSRLQMVVDG
jgi:hypothetical protein